MERYFFRIGREWTLSPADVFLLGVAVVLA